MKCPSRLHPYVKSKLLARDFKTTLVIFKFVYLYLSYKLKYNYSLFKVFFFASKYHTIFRNKTNYSFFESLLLMPVCPRLVKRDIPHIRTQPSRNRNDQICNSRNNFTLPRAHTQILLFLGLRGIDIPSCADPIANRKSDIIYYSIWHDNIDCTFSSERPDFFGLPPMHSIRGTSTTTTRNYGSCFG